MFHLPRGCERTGKIIILCAPVGAEARSSYRSVFLWAQMLAARGHAVLRYDHAGEGDSLPIDPQDDQWERWLLGVEQAAAFARAHSGPNQLVLAGLRLGGLLAVAAAKRVLPDGVILLAPVVTGQSWLRELRWAQRLQTGHVCEGPEVAVSGLSLSARTIGRLEALDLRHFRVNWPRAFLAGPASMPDISAHLGANLIKVDFPGYSRLFQEAHNSQTPEKLFACAADWLNSWAAPPLGRTGPFPAAEFITSDWRERPIVFGAGLHGILTLPRRSPSSRAVIFANTAGDPRAGVGGFTAHACRTLAARGFGALRFDFAGMGESPDLASGSPHVYGTCRTAEFAAAAAMLKALGHDDVTLGGVCTGGYHAVRAVIESEEFRRALAINTWLVWRPEASLDFPDRPVGIPRRHWHEFLTLSFWRDAIRGKVAFARAVEGVKERIGRIRASMHPDKACSVTRDQIARAMVRGADIRLVFARGDVSLLGLEADFGFHGGWLRAHGVGVRMRRELDHAVMSRHAQLAAVEEVADFLTRSLFGVEAPAPIQASPSLPIATLE